MANRLTQVALQAIVLPTSGLGRATQLALTTLVDTEPPARATQLAMTVIRENVADTDPPSQAQARVFG